MPRFLRSPAIPSLISLEKLVEAGWLAADRIAGLPGHAGNVRFEEVEQRKWPLLVEAAHVTFSPTMTISSGCASNASGKRTRSGWPDYVALQRVAAEVPYPAPGLSWPKELAHREAAALAQVPAGEAAMSWKSNKPSNLRSTSSGKRCAAYCAERDIRFIGDVAIFVNFDSADVWTHPEIFELQ